jgi:cysteine dioxygenase
MLYVVSPITITDIIERLTTLPADQICIDSVIERLTDGPLDEHCLRPFMNWREDKYARNLIHRCDLFDVVLLCWEPGQGTRIHSHNGNLGWIRLVSGALEETTYQLVGGGSVPDLTEIEIDEDGVGHGVKLEQTGHSVVSEIGAVSSVDRERAIHRVGNASSEDAAEQLVTLHVYSRPHDSALTYNLAAGTCQRSQFVFDSVPEGLALPNLR